MVPVPSSLGVSCCLLSSYLGFVALVFFCLFLYFFRGTSGVFEFGELVYVRSSRFYYYKETNRKEGWTRQAQR
ncbi:hypothetical protein CGRA01v4_01133 [Colletotrichum graminicola]|nr:hypothetical protein CGRA01v4_01133 [Colletotrichum graminicola]